MQFTESNPYVLRLLEALAGQGPALALLKGRGWGGVYNAIEPTEIEILIRCYLYSAKLPRTRTGRVRHSKSDCTENKANTYYLERELLRKHDCRVGVQTSCLPPLFSWLPHFSPFSIAKYLASLGNCPLFPPLSTLLEFHLLPFSLPLPIPLLPQLSRAPFPFRAAQNNKGGAGGKGWGVGRKRVFLPRPQGSQESLLAGY